MLQPFLFENTLAFYHSNDRRAVLSRQKFFCSVFAIGEGLSGGRDEIVYNGPTPPMGIHRYYLNLFKQVLEIFSKQENEQIHKVELLKLIQSLSIE